MDDYTPHWTDWILVALLAAVVVVPLVMAVSSHHTTDFWLSIEFKDGSRTGLYADSYECTDGKLTVYRPGQTFVFNLREIRSVGVER